MAHTEKLNILLVDDRPDKSLALRSVLEELNQNLTVVSSGKKALEELLKQEFALILLDVRMPVMDGFETARLIRESPLSNSLPIIFISSASPGEIQMNRGYSLGAVDFILSPINPEIIKAKISAILELRRKAKQLEEIVWEKTADLQASEERYRLFLENAKDYAVFFLDLEGKVIEWNPEAERILGWRESEVIGRDVSLIFTDEDVAAGVPERELKKASEGQNASDER